MTRGNDTPGLPATNSAMRTSLRTVALLALLAATATANGQPLEPTFDTYAAEAGGGYTGYVLGSAVGACIALSIGLGNESNVDEAFTVFYSVSPLLAVSGCAGGVCLGGNAFEQDGRFLPTLAYTAGSVALGAGFYAGGHEVAYGRVIKNYTVAQVVGLPLIGIGVAVLAATPVVAVYGYNRSRPRDSFGSRFVPGSVGLASVRDAEGIAHPSLNVRLLSVRF